MALDFSFLDEVAPLPTPKQEEVAEDRPISKFGDCLVTELDSDTIAITVLGVSFNMKLVEGGMLDKFTELSDFYIGETVVTQELWQMIMGENPSMDNRNLQLPVTNIGAAMCNAFIRQLKKLTGADFCIPTVYQWQFAHDGGKKSTRKAKYAGSDNVDEVAWVRTNSDRKLHSVGMLNPNELGLFDMDGNVQEYCMGKLSKTKIYQFNPTYSSDIISVGISAFGDISRPEFTGLRLAINVPISESIISEKIKGEESHNVSFSALSTESPLYDILNRKQQQVEKRFYKEIETEKQRKKTDAEEKQRRKAEALARKHLTHTLTITAAKDQLAGIMATRVALGWTPSESREKFAKLPIEVMVSDDRALAKKVYKQLTDAGVEVDVCTINGLGQIVDATLEDDQRLLSSCKKGKVFTGFQLKYKKSITEYTIPDNYTSIAESAFRDCVNLVTINLPDTIQSIGEYAFASCKSLESVRIPNSVTLIPRKCFEGCESLQTVEMHDSIIEIKSFAFHKCRSLKKLKLPTALKKIGATSLEESGVEKMEIPKGVEIGNRIMECFEGL